MARQQALTALDPHQPPATEPAAFRDPQRLATRELGIKLMREILEFHQRLSAIGEAPSGDRPHLANAWRHAIRIRREMLRDLSEPSD
jgi:hypothetical protein